MMENIGCFFFVFFFYILSKHYISGYYGQFYIGKYSSFVTASLHVKVLSCTVRGTPPQKEGKTGHWLAFSQHNPHFFLEILDQKCTLFNLLEKNFDYILKS